MKQINEANLRDGTSNAGKLTAAFRVGGASGKTLLHKIIAELDVIIQADGTISAPNKTTSTEYLAMIADATFFDKVVKKI